MHKTRKKFNKKTISLKSVPPRTKDNEYKKAEVLNNVEDLYNELYYIYKDKYNEEEFNLNKKNEKIFDYKKLRLTDNCYKSEDEKASQLGGLVLPKWIKISEKRFNEIQSTVTEAKIMDEKLVWVGKKLH